MCRLLRVNRAGDGVWLKTLKSERAKEHERLLMLINHHWLASGSVDGHRECVTRGRCCAGCFGA